MGQLIKYHVYCKECGRTNHFTLDLAQVKEESYISCKSCHVNLIYDITATKLPVNLTIFKGATPGPSEAVVHTISVHCHHCDCDTNFAVEHYHLDNLARATCHVCYVNLIEGLRTELKKLYRHPLTAPKGSNVATAGPNAHESRTLTDIDRVAAQAPNAKRFNQLPKL